jgi:hypothetical protein
MPPVRRQAPPNNPLKLWVEALCAVLAVAIIVLGASKDQWWLVVLAVLALLWLPFRVRAIRQGRNPWWTRAPLDYVTGRDDRRGDERQPAGQSQIDDD